MVLGLPVMVQRHHFREKVAKFLVDFHSIRSCSSLGFGLLVFFRSIGNADQGERHQEYEDSLEGCRSLLHRSHLQGRVHLQGISQSSVKCTRTNFRMYITSLAVPALSLSGIAHSSTNLASSTIVY